MKRPVTIARPKRYIASEPYRLHVVPAVADATRTLLSTADGRAFARISRAETGSGVEMLVQLRDRRRNHIGPSCVRYNFI